MPQDAFFFDRPIVILQSDDWGRVGVRDGDGLEQLRSFGLMLGESPYDLYTLETAEDLNATRDMLLQHRDSVQRSPCMVMNFLSSNLDFARTLADDAKHIHLVPLLHGLPGRWNRPGLRAAYEKGIAAGVFWPALHGSVHFSRRSAQHMLGLNDQRGVLLRTLWAAETPYIHWRMPWVGYEYWNPEDTPEAGFVDATTQDELIRDAVDAFREAFGAPVSACAPGYRANHDTFAAWTRCGIKIAQNGSGAPLPPHFDASGILMLSRTVDFEPAVQQDFSLAACLRQAEDCFAQGVPAIVSVHSINFHSTLRNFRGPTLEHLHHFLSTLEGRHRDLIYLHDGDLLQIVTYGRYEVGGHAVETAAKRRMITAWGTPITGMN